MIQLDIKPWCTCIQRGTWKPQDGWVEDRASGLWVHPRCRKPSRMNYQRHTEKRPMIEENRNMNFMRGEVDIFEKELSLWAKSVISDELDWDLTDE